MEKKKKKVRKANLQLMDRLVYLARKVWYINVEKNKLISEYNRMRERLYRAMKRDDVKEFHIQVLNGEGEAVKHVFVDEAEANSVDVNKLKKLVPEQVFMKCIHANIGDVRSYAGESVLYKCLNLSNSKENVHIKDVEKK